MMRLQKYISKFLPKKRKKNFSEKEIKFIHQINQLVGFNIRNPEVYREAFSLKTPSYHSKSKNYERLEFLGDSVLGSIISSYLFVHYPMANEGYLTQMKSKIVNRKNLNKLGEDLGLTKLLQNGSSMTLGENISGNLFEAFVGAIYMDAGYEICRKTVLDRLLTPSEMNKLENKIVSYKSLLLEWSQKKKIILKYNTEEELQPNHSTVFRTSVLLGEKKLTNATASSKKKAEEKAAQRAFYILNKKQNIIEKPKTIS